MAFNLGYLEKEVQDQYLYDENKHRPWIIGFSGGKDSTMLLQVVWNAIKKIPATKRQRKIYVVCNDTLVENPRIVKFIDSTLAKIQKEASKQSMPVTVHKTTPRLEDTFWVNLIGKGYPAPNNFFRWCTERLKINPTARFIRERIKENTEAIILLGIRYDESATRSKSIKKYEISGKRLRKHVLPNAYIFSPIKNVTTDELWQYLMQVSSPWGANNKELLALYRNSNSGDCPVPTDDLDKNSPSCGQSRFGCWVCTVVKTDKSMEGLIEHGEEWMQPLIEIRNLLSVSRDDLSWRHTKRRNNQEGAGPYLEERRAEILEKLLIAQKEIRNDHPDIELINHQELVAIQLNWYRDGYYDKKVSDIYNNVFHEGLDMSIHDSKIRKEEELLKFSCKTNSDDFDLIQDLLSIQKTKTLMLRKRGLQSDIESRIEKFISEKNLK